MKGSIVERGVDKGKKNGKRKSFAIVIDTGRDQNGKRTQKWFSGYKTRTEAEKALPELLLKVQNGQYFKNEKMTLSEYLKYWLENYAKPNVASSTLKRYEFFTNDIVEYLGNIPLNKLNPGLIQNLYTELGKKISTSTGKPLSNSTILKTHRMLHLALKHAVNWQMLSVNYTENVQAPRAEKPEMSTWDIKIIKEFLEKIKDEPIYIAVVLTVETGMRQGEICGLKWSNIDLVNENLYVKYTMARDKYSKVLILKEPKTKKSRRNIALMKTTIKVLNKHKNIQKSNKILLGELYKDDDFVCTWQDGRCFDPGYISKRFRELVEKFNFPKIRFHDLRHSHATLLLQQGTNPKIVSERLGHSTVSITLDIYSHVTPNIQREAVNKLNDFYEAN